MKTKQKAAIAYNTNTKQYCVTSEDVAKSMLYMGNEYGFNRVTVFPQSSIPHMNDVMKANGFAPVP